MPSVQRYLLEELRIAYEVSERKASDTMTFPRSTIRYRSIKDPKNPLRMRLKELPMVRDRVTGAFILCFTERGGRMEDGFQYGAALTVL